MGFFLRLPTWQVKFSCDKIQHMETIRTICCKLDPTCAQVVEIEATLAAFAGACNRIAEVARTIHSSNKVVVQKECYQAIRTDFGLSANLTIRAIARVCAALKVPEKMHSSFEPTSIDYDARIFSFREWDWSFSLTMLNGRERFATCLGEFQKEALKGQHPTSAALVKRDGQYFLHVQVKEQVAAPAEVKAFLGVDLGIARLATDSDGVAYSGKPVETIRRKHNLQRKRLQRRNSKGAKKKLKRVAKKEALFRRHESHVISKRIVESAKRTSRGIALENLEGIRQRVTARGGDAKNRLSGWGFAQLGSFIKYKACRAGVLVVQVDPRNTSRTCSRCGHCDKLNRKSQSEFSCRSCAFAMNADENAARNIRALGISKMPIGLADVVVQPESPQL
jgi:putative transposase